MTDLSLPNFSHTPVMLQECLEALCVRSDGMYLDGTAGSGGHAVAIARQLGTGHLYALDQDPDAVRAATKILEKMPATVMQANFSEATQVLKQCGVQKLDGALLDLGVSSHQLDTPERGFSFHNEAPLDMRMSQAGPTAAELVNRASREELADIFRKFGEEKYAWQIAGKIVTARQVAPIETTGQLADIIVSALPAAVRRKEKHPARRVFQAIRISINREFEVLDAGLDQIFAMLKPGGRLVVLTFHSLEDRIVKQKFRTYATGCTCPPDFPVCVCGRVPSAKLVGKNPMIPSEREVEQNPRSRSAKLRVVERLV